MQFGGYCGPLKFVDSVFSKTITHVVYSGISFLVLHVKNVLQSEEAEEHVFSLRFK